jgi:hypothetical protein
MKSKLTIEKMKLEVNDNLSVVENIENQHNNELARVDAKVRAVLNTRDSIIDDLKQKLIHSEAKSNEADKVRSIILIHNINYSLFLTLYYYLYLY